MRFASKRAVVTGATGAIGGAIASALSDEGAAIDVVSRQKQRGAKYGWHIVDLVEDPDIEAKAAAIADKFDRLDFLIHSAGHYSLGHLRDMSVAELDRLWHTNVRATWALTRALLPALIKAKGTIVFINSSIWMRSSANLGGYAATKYASKAIADALREEIAADGVHVQSVFPGSTAGDMQKRRAENEGRPYDPESLIQPDHIARTVLDNLVSRELDEIIISR